MEFVESIQAEGVELERKAMDEGTKAKTLLVVEIDKGNDKKDIAPGFGDSVIFGTNVTAAAPGSARGLYLVVADMRLRARNYSAAA